MQKSYQVWHRISRKKWSVWQFAMKFPCMDKVLYGENKVLNCAIVSSSHCHWRQMVQSFLRSQTEHIRRGLSNRKKLRLLQVTRFFVDTFFLRPPVRSGFYAAIRKKSGLQIDFALILYHITEQSMFTFYCFDKSPDIEKIWNSSMKFHRQSLKFLDSKNSKDNPPTLYGIV